MARDETQRSVRKDQPLTEGTRPVQLRSTRRFYTAQGSDRAVRQARALTGALGAGVDLYGDILEKRNEEGAASALQESAEGGERDSENTNKGYNETFDQVEAANDLAVFAKELPQILDEAAWSDMPEDQAQKVIDEYYQGQLEGINPDSVYGKIVAEGILKQNAELLDVHRTNTAAKLQQEKRRMVYGELRRDYELDGTIDHEKLMDRLHQLVPGPGGRMTYLESVFDLAEELGDPSLIDSIPEKFPSGDPTGVDDPNMKDLFDDAKAKAQSVKTARENAADAAYKEANRNALAVQHSADKQLADAGDERVLANIAAGTREGPHGEPARYSEAQATALYDRYLNATDKASTNAIMVDEYASGNAIGYTQTELDQAHNAFVDNLLANKPDNVEEADWQQQVATVALERAVVNGKLPSVYKAQLSVNLSNPEKFKEAAQLYDMIEAQRPGFAETQIGAAQSRKLDAYDRMLAETGGNEEQALKLLEGFEPGRSSNFNAEVGASITSTSEALADSKPGWGDYANNTRLRSAVADEVRFYVDMGFEPEVAEQYAFEHLSRRYIRAGDYLYPKDAGWGADPQMVYDWAIENEAAHRGVDPDTIEMRPTGDPKLVVFMAEGDVLPSTSPVRIDVLGQDYLRSKNERTQQKTEAFESSSDERLKEAEQRAYAKRYRSNPWVESGARGQLHKLHKERWDNLDPELKKKLIAEQLL